MSHHPDLSATRSGKSDIKSQLFRRSHSTYARLAWVPIACFGAFQLIRVWGPGSGSLEILSDLAKIPLGFGFVVGPGVFTIWGFRLVRSARTLGKSVLIPAIWAGLNLVMFLVILWFLWQALIYAYRYA